MPESRPARAFRTWRTRHSHAGLWRARYRVRTQAVPRMRRVRATPLIVITVLLGAWITVLILVFPSPRVTCRPELHAPGRTTCALVTDQGQGYPGKP